MYTTNTNRITGLSGIDTDSLITKLMTAESQKLYRYQRKVQWKTWQQEAFRDVISKFDTFKSSWVGTSASSFRFSSAFQKFKNSVKDSTGAESKAITINSSSSSQNYKISVEELAQADTYTAGNTVLRKVEGDIKAADIASKLNAGETLEFNFTLDGKTKAISLKSGDFSGAINEASIKSVLNSKLKDSFGSEGSEQKVSVDINSGKFKLSTELGHTVSVSDTKTSPESSTISLNDADSEAKGAFTVKVDNKTYSVTVNENTEGETLAAKINNALKTAVSSDGTTVDLSRTISASTTVDKKLKLSNNSASKGVEISNSSLNGVSNTFLKSTSELNNLFGIPSGSSNAIKAGTTLEEIFGDGDDIWDKAGKASLTINDETIDFSRDDSLAVFTSKAKNSGMGVNIVYNNTNAKFTIEAAETGAVNAIKFGSDASTQKIMKRMGFQVSDSNDYTSQRTKIAQDAELTIDGIRTTRESNTFDLEGMNITLNSKTAAGEEISIGNEFDVDAVYDNISKFVEEYNTLIGSLNTSVKESRAKSDDYTYYEPLTDAERKEMTEDEIKLWEEKAKTGLLYKDSTIQSVLSKMRSIMYGAITLENGQKIGLYDLGITTSSNYHDEGKLIIDEDKLKAAIRENGDAIQQLFNGNSNGKGIADKLSDVIDGAIGTKGSLREKAGIVGTASVNENTLSKQIKELNEKIAAEKEKLVNTETNYYKMFSSMESSVMTSNSQMDALLSMLGQ